MPQNIKIAFSPGRRLWKLYHEIAPLREKIREEAIYHAASKTTFLRSGTLVAARRNLQGFDKSKSYA